MQRLASKESLIVGFGFLVAFLVSSLPASSAVARVEAKTETEESERQQAASSQTQTTPSQPQVGIEDIFAFIAEAKVTTATRTERSLRTVPGAVSVITRQQIEQTGATTVGEVLRLLPGINVRLSPMGGVFGVRSFGASPFTERVLLLIDGVPYNSPDKGGFAGHPAYEDFFPVDHISRLEVIKGPGSALYGQNALQGVVNIITRNGRTLEGGEVDFLGGDQDTAQFRITQGVSRGDFDYSFTGKIKNQKGSMEFIRDSAFDTGDLYFNSNYKGFQASYLYHRDEFDGFDFGGEPVLSSLPSKQTLNLVSLGWDGKLSESWSANLKFLFNRRDGSTCASCHDAGANGTPILSTGELADASFIEAHQEINQRYWINFLLNLNPPESRHNVIFGVEYQSDQTTKDIVQRIDGDDTVTNAAGFIQDEISLAGGNVITTFGARFDDNEYTGNFFSPSASVVVSATADFIVRGSVGRAFRQPTWNDLFIDQRFISRTIPTIAGTPTEFRRIGEPELRSEEVDTFQAGVEYFFNRDTSLKADFFYSKYRDFIETNNFSPFGFPPFLPFPPRPDIVGPGGPAFLAFANNREEDISAKGGELELRFRPSQQFSGIIGYSYQTNDLDPATESQAAYGPEHKIAAIINFEPHPRLRVNFNVSTWSHFNTSSAGLTLGLDEGNPEGVRFDEKLGEPYALANLVVSFDLWHRSPSEKFGVTLQIKNLFDETVQTHPANGIDTSLLGLQPFFRVFYFF